MPNSKTYLLNSELQYLTLRDPNLQKRFKDGHLRAVNTLPLPGQSLQEQYPIIQKQFIRMLNENMSNLRPIDIKTSEKHRALWNCQICGKEFTSQVKIITSRNECTCVSCKQRKKMKDLKERNRRIKEENRGRHHQQVADQGRIKTNIV